MSRPPQCRCGLSGPTTLDDGKMPPGKCVSRMADRTVISRLEATGSCGGNAADLSHELPGSGHRPEWNQRMLDQRLGRRIVGLAELEACAVEREVATGQRPVECDRVADQVVKCAPGIFATSGLVDQQRQQGANDRFMLGENRLLQLERDVVRSGPVAARGPRSEA